MKKTYHGSCHCGEIRFEADIDLSAGTGRCNCSFCTKARIWGVLLTPEDFRLTSGADAAGDYLFGTRTMHHVFCMHCGVHLYMWGHAEAAGRDIYGVSLACLDDADPAELVEAPLQYVDGRNENWNAPPAEVRHL